MDLIKICFNYCGVNIHYFKSSMSECVSLEVVETIANYRDPTLVGASVELKSQISLQIFRNQKCYHQRNGSYSFFAFQPSMQNRPNTQYTQRFFVIVIPSLSLFIPHENISHNLFEIFSLGF